MHFVNGLGRDNVVEEEGLEEGVRELGVLLKEGSCLFGVCVNERLEVC